jgi:hypothetical protein
LCALALHFAYYNFCRINKNTPTMETGLTWYIRQELKRPASLLRRSIMQKWEYMIVSSPNEETLNELGEQGWELVAFSPYGKAYLKRLKS